MKPVRFGAAFVLVATMIAAEAGAQTLGQIPDASQRIYLHGVSFSRPPGDGWAVEMKEGHGRISFRKDLSQDRLLTAGVLTWVLTGVTNRDELLASARKDLQDPDLIGPETRVLSGEAKLDSVQGVACVRYHYRYLQPQRGKAKASIFSVYGIRLMHPGASRPLTVGAWYMDWKTITDRKDETVLAASPEPPPSAEGQAFLESLRLVDRDSRLRYSDPVSDAQGVAFGHGSLWVAEIESHQLFRIDPANGHVVARIPVGRAPVDVAIGEGAVWVTNSADATVSRIDPGANQVAATVTVGKGPLLLAVGAGSVWVTNSGDGTVSRIDPRTNQMQGKPIKVGKMPSQPSGILYHDGVVWVTDVQGDALIRIDPQTNKLLGKPIPVGSGPNDLAFGAGSLWVNCQSAKPAAVWRIDPSSGARIALIPTSRRPSAIAFVHDTVWVCDNDEGTVSRIDPTTNRIAGEPIHAGFGLVFIRAGDGALWATDQDGGAVIRIPYE